MSSEKIFHLKLLGTLSLQDSSASSQPQPLQKKRLELLAILAIGEQVGISRDRVQAFLWPESDANRARHALDQLTYSTRRALGRDPFSVTAGEIRLDPNVIGSDVREFEKAFLAGEFEMAASIYGGPLLHGIHLTDSRELESWIDGERARLASAYQQSLQKLAESAAACGDVGGDVLWWKKLSLSDPLSSRIALGVMRALERAGDTPGAVQHARNYDRLMHKELQIAADPEIRAFAKSLASSLDARTPTGTPVFSKRASELHPMPTVPPAGSGKNSRNIVGRSAFAVAVILIAVLLTRYNGVAAIDPRVNNTSAKRLYLSGINAWNDRSKEGLDSAVIDFRRAIEIDPLYADAYAGLANAYVMIGYSGYRPAKAMFPKAKAAALRSIQLDSGQAAPFAVLGMELTWERKFADAERVFQKALALDSTYATGHQWYGILLMITGRKTEAVAELKRAAELDPLSLQIQNNYATFLGAVGQREAQLQHYENVVAQEPDSAWVRRNPWLLANMAGAYIHANQLAKAKRAAERAVEILPGHPRAVGTLAAVYRKMGDVDRARALYATADTTNEHYAAYRGFWYLEENKIDSAFISFNKVEEWGIPIMISIANLPPSIKRDPRYAELTARLGIPTQGLSNHP